MSEEERKIINRELERIEKEENIKILFAVESGSRAWGFESKDSDFDVRFVYVSPLSWYLSVSKRKDTMEVMINKDLDLAGWDLQKALVLLSKCNPPLGEWLNSHIVYKESEHFREEFQTLFRKYLREDKLVYHYLSMASKDLNLLENNKEIKLKKYFYILRALLASKWVLLCHSDPPILFEELLSLVEDHDVLKEIRILLEMKKSGDEKTKVIGNELVNNYIFQVKLEIDELIKEIKYIKNSDLSSLDMFFLEKVNYYHENK